VVVAIQTNVQFDAVHGCVNIAIRVASVVDTAIGFRKAVGVRTPPAASESNTYEAPAVVVHGSVADITGAILPGTVVDHTFPAGAVSVNATISL
jgi:hypothetical protein